MPICLDYTSRIDPALLRAAGVTVVCRYLSWLYYWGGRVHAEPNPKVIRQPEYQELVSAGLTVVLNWEYDSRDWLGGAAAGTSHASEAVSQARALGYPLGAPIIGSADLDMTRAQWVSAGAAYAEAFEAGVRLAAYTPGVYGPYDVLTWCRDETGMQIFWQAGMSTAWSAGRNALPWPGAQLRQRSTRTIGGQVADWSDILGRIDVAAGDADKAFSAQYTGTEPWVSGQSWMSKAVENPLAKANETLELIQQDVQALSGGGVDLDALAGKVAVQLAPLIPSAAQVAAQIIQQLAGQK